MKEGLRFAAIDIGSNAMRLLFCRVIENGGNPHFIKESLIRMPLRLGHDAFTIGAISPRNCNKFVNAMIGFNHLISAYGPISFRACATAAMRNADNGKELVKRIQDEATITLNIISGKEEAAMILANHIERTLKPNQDYFYVDVGGGSTELTLIRDKQTFASSSFSIGSVRLLEGKVEENEWIRMRSWIKKKSQQTKNMQAIGSGGNINKISAMLGKEKGKTVKYKKIKDLLEDIEPYSIHDRVAKLGLRPDRADVVIHAGKIYLNCMRWAGVRKMVVPQVGLPDGIVTQLYKEYRSK